METNGDNIVNLRSNPSIYSAGKVYNAERFREMRDLYGYNINARWIDLSEQAAENKQLVWELCHADACAADMVIIYCHDYYDYPLGTLIEAGHAMGQNRPVYCINRCIHTVPGDKSDCAYTFHSLWTTIENEDGSFMDIREGYRRVMAHYFPNWVTAEPFATAAE